MNLQDLHHKLGARLAPDGIPLQFGSLEDEYRAGLNQIVLFDRSHEGRILVTGADRLDLLNRISTNELLSLQAGQDRATIFTNPTGRILERAVVHVFNEQAVFLLTGPGRGVPLKNYLQRNIFFKDDVRLHDYATDTHQFALHGPHADEVIEKFKTSLADLELENEGQDVFLGRMKPFNGGHWVIVVNKAAAATVWQNLLDIGQPEGILPAGGIMYNTLRIYAGQPGVGRELTTDYIPLELGLWDEISFHKGCYTGQEIIARMESRNQLAKAMVSLELSRMVDAPADLYADGKPVGVITSSVMSPDKHIYAMGIVKTAWTASGTALMAAGDVPVKVKERLGVFPKSDKRN